MKQYWILILAVVVVGSLSLSKSVGFGAQHVIALEQILGGDKDLHFLCAFVLTSLSVWVTRTRVRNSKTVRLIGWPTLVVVVLMMLDESSQFWLQRREFSVDDMMTNLLGVAIALCVATFVNYILSNKARSDD
ncbi:VanZ family protein [Vibrio gazogenes]|uniref:VanZ like family protein n=1 Tax=Vibrio gazogenes DSM 21264 = NBRC 103151 TaxID=1123492 RepID=A0A1M5E9R1_VIBGA|nr:VanZ family protein [Vibrio gazogenes]USP14294.1 VanZ family protein [Vibrio gazogenes]SHF75791.1 VanZ like family protein [Vibrio gazogenes DSM 21264] [Vibrio gazogenes DSM 21264 = NBRC 103151]SJN58461.1 VanZ like family protein [Vibrio gazogenes]